MRKSYRPNHATLHIREVLVFKSTAIPVHRIYVVCAHNASVVVLKFWMGCLLLACSASITANGSRRQRLAGHNWPKLRHLCNATTHIEIFFRPEAKDVLQDQRPTRLGLPVELDIPPNASPAQKERITQLRMFIVHKVEVWSLDIPPHFRPFTQKISVEGCCIRFRYIRVDNEKEEPLFGGRWLYGRWDDNPEPLSEGKGFARSIATTNRRLAKLIPTERREHIDAYPFNVSFVMKKIGRQDCYHFNDDSYQFSEWHHAGWVLPVGTYRVEVRLTGYGLLGATTKQLRLTNSATQLQDFSLEEWGQNRVR